MNRMSFEIFNNSSDFIHKKFKIRNIHSLLSSRESKSFLKNFSSIQIQILTLRKFFLSTKVIALSKFIHANACKVSKSSFSMGIPSRINLWRFS